MKKTVNLAVCATFFLSTVLTTNLSAMGSGPLDSAMMNITAAQEYTSTDSSGNPISVNYYTGGAAFRFNSNSYPPPLFAVSPPQLSAGCNGLNMKGMFVSLLGLDQLGAMLQNAGASLAWGVAIGLIYSLPGVGSAFRMINEWATKLQQILGQMCNSGIALGKTIAENTFKSEFDKEAKQIENWGTDTSAKIQNGMGSTLESFGIKGAKIEDNGLITFGASNKEMPKEDKKDAIVAMFKSRFVQDKSFGAALMDVYLKKTANVAAFQKIFKDLMDKTSATNSKPYETQSFYYTYDNNSGQSGAISLNDLAANISSLDDQQAIKLAGISYMLLFNTSGDLCQSGSLDGFNKGFQNFLDGNSTSIGAAQTYLASHKLSDFQEVKSVLAGQQIDSTTAGIRIANFILHGISSADNNDTLAVGKELFKSPKLTMVAAKEPNSAIYKYIPICDTSAVVPSESDKLPAINFFSSSSKFTGVATASRCAIETAIGENAATIRGSSEYNTIASTCGLTIVFNGFEKFLKVIKDSPKEDQDALKELLISYNTKEVSNTLLNGIFAQLGYIDKSSASEFSSYDSVTPTGSSQGGAGVSKGNDAALSAFALKKSWSDAVKVAKIAMGNAPEKTDISKRDVLDEFAKQVAKNRARGIDAIKK